MTRRLPWFPIAAIVAVAAYYVAFRTGPPAELITLPAFDVYGYFYPNVLYALGRLRDGGAGLLWNPYQNCGQPFFANSQTGLLYPANALFLLFDPDRALRGVMAFNLVVAGVSAYLLCRELGAGRLAALAGALAFELGNTTVEMTNWGPTMAGPYVWLPASMLFCERLIRAPTAFGVVALGTTLGIALLPGYVQTVFLTYQLILLRVVWELARRRGTGASRMVWTMGLALVLPPLLFAVQLLPAIEVARESVRNATLTPREMNPAGGLDLQELRQWMAMRTPKVPFVLIPCMLGSLGVLRPAMRRHGLFYAVAGLVFFVLAFGTNTWLGSLYLELPFTAAFRFPQNTLWLTSFCLAVLTALGLDGLLQLSAGSPARAMAARIALAAVAPALFFILDPTGLRPLEWALAGFAIMAIAVATTTPVARRWAGGGVVLILLANFLLLPAARQILSLLPNDGPLFTNQRVFGDLRERLSPQDRAYLVIRHPIELQFTLMEKSASLFRVPVIQDYEPQTARRYAEFFVMLRTGRAMKSLNDILFNDSKWTPPEHNRRLLDLSAARYLVVDTKLDNVDAVMNPPLRRLDDRGAVRIYENRQALPRSFYVPRVVVVRDRGALLHRLGTGADDLRRTSLIESPPSSGFTGESNVGDGTVEFVRDEPERVTLRTHAPEHGFVFLADEYFPGWHATVDGEPTPILRANHAFRLVEVPAGDSLVEFRYAPLSLRLGALVSGLTLFMSAVAVLASNRRVRRRA